MTFQPLLFSGLIGLSQDSCSPGINLRKRVKGEKEKEKEKRKKLKY